MPFTSLHALYHVLLAFADRLFGLIFQNLDRFVNGFQIDADFRLSLYVSPSPARRGRGGMDCGHDAHISQDLAVRLMMPRQSTAL